MKLGIIFLKAHTKTLFKPSILYQKYPFSASTHFCHNNGDLNILLWIKKSKIVIVNIFINFKENSISNESQANVDFVNGLIKLTIKLPARGELCEFNLKLMNDTVGTLVESLKLEDKSIEKAQLFNQGQETT